MRSVAHLFGDWLWASARRLLGLIESQYAKKLYQTDQAELPVAECSPTTEDEVDIEAEIKQELADIRQPTKTSLFTSVKLDTQCCRSLICVVLIPLIFVLVMFFRTRSPVEPVSFVERICRDLTTGAQLQNCRYVKRLTPITATEKANTKGLEIVAKQVLAPHFHVAGQAGKKVSSIYALNNFVAMF